MLYRSDALDKLTDQDQRYLERLGLNHIVDFRSADEVQRCTRQVTAGAGAALGQPADRFRPA